MYVSVSNLHFPQMNLASEKPPEAVLEGVIFKNFPDPLDYARHPSFPREIWPHRFFLLPTALDQAFLMHDRIVKTVTYGYLGYREWYAIV